MYKTKMWFYSSTLVHILLASLSVIHIIESATFRCYNGSFNNYQEFSLNNSVAILNSSCFDKNKNTTFIASGYDYVDNGPAVKTMYEAYFGRYNVIQMNWANEAASGILGYNLGYIAAVGRVPGVAKQFGQSISQMISAGVSEDCIRVVGFSLGAHVGGVSGAEVQKSGRTISRIIALEPAQLLYDGTTREQLGPTNAKYVKVIHTNPGGLGTVQKRGCVDIWVNCGNRVQPGCASAGGGLPLLGLLQGPNTPENMCSHNRSWMYFGEAMSRPNTFIGRYALSCNDWKTLSPSQITTPLEDVNEIRSCGNYYLNTNSVPLYGRGQAGSLP